MALTTADLLIERLIDWGVDTSPSFGVDLQPIDFAGVARACGIRGYTLTRPQDADSVMREAFAHPDAALVEAVIDPNEPPMPGHINSSQALNFAKALARGDESRFAIIKDVLRDKVREVI